MFNYSASTRPENSSVVGRAHLAGPAPASRSVSGVREFLSPHKTLFTSERQRCRLELPGRHCFADVNTSYGMTLGGYLFLELIQSTCLFASLAVRRIKWRKLCGIFSVSR